jgi:hypothetical protein
MADQPQPLVLLYRCLHVIIVDEYEERCGWMRRKILAGPRGGACDDAREWDEL